MFNPREFNSPPACYCLPPCRLFNPREFNELISGGEGSGVDVADMRQWVRYSGGYTGSSSAIKLFWKVGGGVGGERSVGALQRGLHVQQ